MKKTIEIEESELELLLMYAHEGMKYYLRACEAMADNEYGSLNDEEVANQLHHAYITKQHIKKLREYVHNSK